MFIDLICPKCGGQVVWCNGGDVVYDFPSQFKATCPSCGYEDWESNFTRGEKLTLEERIRLLSEFTHSRKPNKGK